MDFLTTAKRSALMGRVRGKHTKPEITVRRVVRGLGYKFKTNLRSLPATPDIAFPDSRKVILVHGCFWHRHARCVKASTPKTHVRFWKQKFESNKRRDRLKLRQLRSKGWRALTLWECEVKFPDKLRERIRNYLETP
jgi:DNA mismatch endonuclease, patch repair protein